MMTRPSLTAEGCQALQGRKALLFPDAGAWGRWEQRAQELAKHLRVWVKVSDWLEGHASHQALEQEVDLADYFMEKPYAHWLENYPKVSTH